MATRTAASVARRSPPARKVPRPPVSRLPAPPLATLRLTPARTGDHGLIHRLLVSVFHGPSAGEFHAQLDEPGYEPAYRLVVRDGEQIAAHLRLARQTIQVGAAPLPAARFMDLATAPEYRGRGLAQGLLAAGQRLAAERGVLVALTRTRVSGLFARFGWTPCGRHCFSSAAPRAVLAELSAVAQCHNGQARSPLAAPPAPAALVVRPLRRIELPAVMRLYDHNLAGHSGWPLRSEAYWDWLLARGACDGIYVAATCSESVELPKLLDSIVGYACVRQCRLVELCVAPDRADAALQLAARVCADASEQGQWLVRCDVPPAHELHDLFRHAGGQHTLAAEQSGEVFMAKLLDPLAALRRLAPELHQRARAAAAPRPSELGLELHSGAKRGGVVERFRLKLTRRAVRVETGGPSRHTISLRSTAFAPLLLGDISAADLLSAGRLTPASRKAATLAQALFPTANWWRPPLDDLLA
jgi:predicted N-acetyltransferase YhbS